MFCQFGNGNGFGPSSGAHLKHFSGLEILHNLKLLLRSTKVVKSKLHRCFVFDINSIRFFSNDISPDKRFYLFSELGRALW